MKKYKDICSFIKDVTGDDNFTSDVKKEMADRTLVTYLLAMRLKKEISQSKMSQKMQCSQAKISKIENSLDKYLKFDDILKYCSALGLELNIGFADANVTLAGRVKFHVLQAKKYLLKLANIAGSDKVIWEGVSKFFDEAGFNMLMTIFEGKKVLQKHKHAAGPTLHISSDIVGEKASEENNSNLVHSS